ncbi:TonB-dependent receptor [Chitinophaga filiformis]|uniref:TonB-dependent receptor n=1 Tax=Chitinophaga filiformis TaxID=104663 RepID=A0ABY4I3L7_CHIFI|nr:TonB-dependent receptor [Chitinophaga filiformis]UPK70686.1 TonB-dependent receptor [Chitinophaga filiformis]
MMKFTGHYTRATLLFFVVLLSFFTTANASSFNEDNNGIIKGKVKTSDGKPAADVPVILQGTAQATTTDGAGSFAFRGVPAGNYQIIISQPGFANIIKEVTVSSGQTITLDFQLDISRQELNEVVITGTQNKLVKRSSEYVSKLPLANIENPQIYTTITKDLMANQLVYSVDDAMRNAPGIARLWESTGRSGDGGSYYSSRGFIVQSQLRNGVAGNVATKIDAANLERLEVIKGPSATLFGSTLTSYGGLINRVTKKPYDHFGGEITYAGGSFSYNRLQADINTPLDSTGKVALRLNTAYTYENSWQDNGFNKTIAFAPSVSYKVSDRLSFQFDAEYYSGEGTGNTIFFFPWGLNMSRLSGQSADKLNIDYKRSFFNEDLIQKSRNMNFFATMNYKISGQWTSQTIFTNTNSYSDGAGPYFYLLPGDSISRNDQFTDNSKVGVTEIQQNFSGDFKIGNMRNRFVGGLDFFFLNEDEYYSGGTYDIVPSHGTIADYNGFNRANMDKIYQNGGYTFTYPVIYKAYTYSAYASDVLNITDKLAVQAALRIDHFDRKGTYDNTSGKTGNDGYTQTALSPKFGVVYQIIKDKLSVFGNYQNGFKNVAGYDSSKRKAFTPEQANQIEGGVKMDLFEGRLTGTFSYYDIKVKDIVRTDPEHPLRSIQDGTQLSKGFEAQIIANPIQGLNIIAGFAYNDSKYEKSSADVEGRRPTTAGSPVLANLWLNYRLPVSATRAVNFGFGGNYASETKVVNSVSTGIFTLPEYTVLNATVSYDTNKFRIGAKVDNLTDKHYWIGYSTMNPQKTRSITGSIAFKF